MAQQNGRSTRQDLARLALGALGVVYGDIGTSPLYTLRECFGESAAINPTHGDILGILSLIFWSLILVVTVKYVLFMLRADNRGEGGILALMALVAEKLGRGPRRRIALLLGMIGAALFFGDALLTPAISVLSAVEGLEVAAPVLQPWIVPLSVIVLVVLFAVQRRGTGKVGRIFGPIMLLWFAVLALLGVMSIVRAPTVLAAVDPRHAVWFFGNHGLIGFLVLGVVVLAVTGCEALYADLGHFGRRAMGTTWTFYVLPVPAAELFRPGRAADALPAHGPQPVLPAGAVLGALPADRARHRGHRDRVASGDLGRLFAVAPGRAARLPAAPHHPPHLTREMGRSTCPR